MNKKSTVRWDFLLVLCFVGVIGCHPGRDLTRKEQLIEALESPGKRRRAEERLIRPRAVQELGDFAAKDPAVRQALINHIVSGNVLWQLWRLDLCKSLSRAGAGAVGDILKASDQEGVSLDARVQLLSVLGRIGPAAKEAIPVLRERLKAPEIPLRIQAAVRVVLADIGDASPDNLAAIRSGLAKAGKTADAFLRSMALGGGADWADAKTIAELIGKVESKHHDGRSYSIIVLGLLGEKGGPKAAASLKKAFDASIEARHSNYILLGCALARADHAGSRKHLQRVMKHLGTGGMGGPERMWEWLMVRGILSDAAMAKDINALLKSSDLHVVKGAVSMAGALGLEARAAAPGLLEVLETHKDEDMRELAATGLGVVLPASQIEKLKAASSKERLYSGVQTAIFKSIRIIRLGHPLPDELPLWDRGPADKSLNYLKKNIRAMSREEINNRLGYMAFGGHLKSVLFLLSRGADPNSQCDLSVGAKPICLAVKHGDKKIGEPVIEKIVAALIAHGADVNYAGSGMSPLHWAALHGRTEIAKLLIAKGAKIDMVNVNGATPLHVAATYGSLDVVKVLLACGADVNVRQKDDYGYATALQSAIVGDSSLEKFTAIVKLLLEHDADPNIPTKGGYSPLGTAAFRGRIDMVKLLIAHGAKINSRDKDGNTPLKLAIKKGHRRTAALLREHGAKE